MANVKFCGVKAVIAVDEGVVKCRTVRRVKEEDKWNVERVKAVKGRPRAPDPNKEGDDRIPVSVHIPQAQGQPPQEPQAPEELTRRIYIKKTDVETYGKTPGCPGCESMGRGGKAKNHTETCRNRLEEEMKKTEQGQERIKEAEKRMDESLARRLEKIGVRKCCGGLLRYNKSCVRPCAAGTPPFI